MNSTSKDSASNTTNTSKSNNDDKITLQRQPASKVDCWLSYFRLSNIFNNSKIVAVIRLSGMIGKADSIRSGLNIYSLNNTIEKAFSLSRLVAVCLVIDSPGGSPAQSELIAERIINLSRAKKIPVYSFVEDVAASGGYWLACAGEEIYALKSSIIGSIGVISAGFGLHKAISKLGIERRLYSAGDNKSILDPFLPEQKQDVEIIQDIQREVHEHFISYVKQRRENKITQDDKEIYNGKFWTGQKALEYGLIDGINDIYSFLNTKYGDSIKIEYMSLQQGWLKRKLGLKMEEVAEQLVNKAINSIENKIFDDKYRLK